MTSFTNQSFEQLRNILDRNPNSMLFARLADFYLERNEVEKALSLAQKGVELHADYVTGFFVLAKCHMRLRHYEEAEKALKKVLILDSKFLLAHKNYGDLLIDIGGWDNAAEASYRRILEIDPLDEDTRAMLEALKQKQNATMAEENQHPAMEEMEVPSVISEKLSDEDLLVVSEEEEEPVSTPSLEQISDRLDLDDEEARFSSILDDIFGEKLSKEEQKEEETRRIMEKHPDSKDFERESNIKVQEKSESMPPIVEEQEEDNEDVLMPPEKILSANYRRALEEEVEEDTDTFYSREAEKLEDEPSQETALKREQGRDFKKEHIVTPTLGEIYAAQGQYEKAINVYETLLAKNPDNPLYKDKIKHLYQRLEEQRKAM